MLSFKQRVVINFCVRTWRIWERLGIHVLPCHFYWPIPDKKILDDYDFDREFPLHGIRICDSDMLDLLSMLARYKEEYAEVHVSNDCYSAADGAVLYGMVRKLKPSRVWEVGSGFSTAIMWAALEKNKVEDNTPGEIIAIEPYPNSVLKELLSKADNITLVPKRVEVVGPQLFKELKDGDFLVIDSSHVVTIGNDVHYLYLSVLPNVPVGTVVHIHDIRFPYDYPKQWVLQRKWFLTEQYLLHMFMAFNESFEIVFAGNYMYKKYPALMARSLVGENLNDDGWLGCFWIKRTK